MDSALDMRRARSMRWLPNQKLQIIETTDKAQRPTSEQRFSRNARWLWRFRFCASVESGFQDIDLMNTLYLDIFSGISGDMFIGAMLDLGVDAHAFEHQLEKLGLRGYHLHVSRQE